jgi:hypothetical protein
MKALVGLLAACVVFFTFALSAPAQVVFSFGSGYCAPSYYPLYGGYYGYPGYAYSSYYPSYFGFGQGGYYRPWWRHRYYGGYLWRVAEALVGRRTRLAWPRMARASLTRNLGRRIRVLTWF